MQRKIGITVFVTLLVLAGVFVFAIPTLAEDTYAPCGKSGEAVIGLNGLAIKKDVSCALDRAWKWTIDKSADQTELLLSTGQSFTVNYTVNASAVATETYKVKGRISVLNSSASTVTVTGVSDILGDVTCTVSFPYDLAAGNSFVCEYSGSSATQPAVNTATATSADGASVTASAAIDWSKAAVTETDECAAISDTLGGTLGNVCAGTDTSFTFSYPIEIGPFGACETHQIDNTASFTSNDTGTTASATWTVIARTACEEGCTLTPGYWKTHSKYGPARFDETWNAMDGGDAEFFDTGLSYYQVLWTNPSGGNAYFILAHAYIAAELNMLDGASVPADVQAAFGNAQSLLAAYQYSLSIPRGADRTLATELAAILDGYNNGLSGPGHCSE